MYTEEVHEDVYVFERPKMVTVRVQVSDFVPEEEQPISPSGQLPQQQFQDEISLQEGGMLCVLAKGKALGKTPGRTVNVTVPRVVAQAAARVGPNMKSVSVLVGKPR